LERGEKQVLAFDFGASGGRAIIGKLENDKIVMLEVHRFTNDPVIVNGTMYWDTLRQFHEIKQGLMKAKQQGPIDSLGIDTWGVDFGLLDEHGMLLENAVHYRDGRTVGMQEKSFAAIGKEELYEITGNQLMDLNTVFQLYSLVLNRPWLLERADTLLLTPDLFNYFLTGKKAAEYTMASTTQMLNANKRTWSSRILKALQIPERLLPEIIPSGTVVGWIKKDVCEELELAPAKVIAVASHDTQSAVIAVPTQEEDFIFISCGTWSLFGTELSGPSINEESLRFNMTNEGGYGGKTTFLKNIIGLWLIQESRRQWIREGKDYSYGELESMASKVKPLQSFIDPDAPEFMPAGNIPERIREFCKSTGQPVPQTIGEMVCCINQSLAMKYRYTLEQIEACLKKKYPKIYMIGGGIQSKLLCQMTANASDRVVQAGPIEATALGNIAVQLMASGEIKDLREARRIIQKSEESYEYLPEEKGRWQEGYEKFKQILKL